MAPIGEAVYATLLMNDAYLPGAMVLGHSLRDRGAKAKLVVLVTVDQVSSETISELRTIYDDIVPVQQIQNRQPANLYVMGRPDLIATFTKIELWRQTQYKRIVYLDADTVCLRAPNELLKLDTTFAAAPDIGWPDCFNSGMMVLNPNMGDYYALLALAQRGISFDGADQGLLNMHFRDWERVSFAYNCTPSGNYQYVPAYRHFQSSISVVHFIGKDKPWTLGRENKHNSGVYGDLLGRWWAVYDAHYRPQTTAYYSGQSFTAPKKVQDYVKGEEALFVPGYSSYNPPPPQPQHHQQQEQHQPPPQHQQAPAIVIEPPPPETIRRESLTEQPMGDAPDASERVAENDFTPTPTVVQRKFSAPHVEWEPAKAPPPEHSKPEASNFPQTQYEFTSDVNLFQAPKSYPDAPKDMWYEVPPKPVIQSKPKPIFPWEGKAPKPTRVFPEPQLPSPPPEPVVEPEPEPEPTPSETTSVTLDPEPAETPTVTSPDPWAGFQSRTNAWDDIPEIERYMQALQGPRKAKIQVLHNSAAPQSRQQQQQSQKPDGRRRSLKLTDFPTELERPSLPVTPAPIRRPSFWGEERDEDGNLPAAEGVPSQEEWVRRFSSYPVPEFPAFTASKFAAATALSSSSHLHRTESGVLVMRCQYCGQQNPIAKLEELQRKQSEVLSAPDQLLEEPREVPERKMPESESKEKAIEAAEAANTEPEPPLASAPLEQISPRDKRPAKPILKQPSFEVPKTEEVGAAEAPDVLSPTEVPPQVAAAAVEKIVPSADHVEDSEQRAPETVISPPTGTAETVKA